MSPKPPRDDDLAYKAAFVGVLYGHFQYVWDNCIRRTPEDGGLSKWERLAVWLYTTTNGPWFNVINAPLREGRPADADVRIVTECLHDAIRKLPRHDRRVYRGIRVRNLSDFVRAYTTADGGIGAVVTWPAFSSGSIDPDRAITGNVLFIIHSNDGRRMGFYAEHFDEQEVVFLPGSRFRVMGLELNQTKAIITLQQVGPVG